MMLELDVAFEDMSESERQEMSVHAGDIVVVTHAGHRCAERHMMDEGAIGRIVSRRADTRENKPESWIITFDPGQPRDSLSPTYGDDGGEITQWLYATHFQKIKL